MEKRANTAKYKGYCAVYSEEGTWRSSHDWNRSAPVYRLKVKTPVSLSVSAQKARIRIREDLDPVFPGIDFYSHEEYNRRVFHGSEYFSMESDAVSRNPYLVAGCLLGQNWKQDRWTITLILTEPFVGFRQEAAVPAPEEQSLFDMWDELFPG